MPDRARLERHAPVDDCGYSGARRVLRRLCALARGEEALARFRAGDPVTRGLLVDGRVNPTCAKCGYPVRFQKGQVGGAKTAPRWWREQQPIPRVDRWALWSDFKRRLAETAFCC